MAGSRSKTSDESYYSWDKKRPQGQNEGKTRKVDVFAGKESLADCLKRRRKWVEGGMQGPRPECGQ